MDQNLATKKEKYLGYAWISKTYFSDPPISYSSSCGSLKMCVNQPNIYLHLFTQRYCFLRQKCSAVSLLWWPFLPTCLEIMPKFMDMKRWCGYYSSNLIKCTMCCIQCWVFTGQVSPKAKRLTWQLTTTIDKVWSKFKNAASVISDLNLLFVLCKILTDN